MLVMALIAGALARPPGCEQVGLKGWKKALAASEEALRVGEFGKAGAMLDETEDRLACLEELAPKELLGAVARQRAYQSMMEFDEVQATQWVQLARITTPEFSWFSWVPDRHIVRRLDREPDPMSGRVRDKGLVIPDGGGVFLDGRYLLVPEAEADVPHLLQVANGEGVVVNAEWISGAAFPDYALSSDAAEAPPPPLWFTNPVDPAELRRARRGRRAQSAAGVAAVSAATFVTAWMARGAYSEHPTDGLRTVVNGATVASGALGVGALGIGVFALVGP